MSENKAVNVALPVEVAERLRREAFERRVSQGSIVTVALGELWSAEQRGDPVDRERTS